MRRVVLDAGPLISFLSQKDKEHATCTKGFTALHGAGVEIVIPLPIVFEVHKWFLLRSSSALTNRVFPYIQKALVTIYFNEELLHSVVALRNGIDGWGGTLEDASVALIALRGNLPIWTHNYRDFAAIPKLEFWNP